MAGSASVPNTFTAAQGLVPASQLDANWAALVAYINAREIDSGTLAARPIGSDGQWYFATDVAGGQLFFNAGGFWVPGAPGATSGVIVPVPVSQGGTGLSAAGANSTILMADSTQPAGVRWVTEGPSQFAFMDAGAALGAGVTEYLGQWAANPNNPNNPAVNRIITRAGLLSELFVWVSGPPGAGQSYAFTVMKNGAACPLQVTLTGSVDRTGNSTSQTVNVAAGDTITIRAVGSAGAVSGVAPSVALSFYPIH